MSLDGKVAWVAGLGDEDRESLGRAVALALSARGVRVLVTGPVERSLGIMVGEVAHGGGKARHLVVADGDPVGAEAALAKAIEAFGQLDFAIACDVARGDGDDVLVGARCTFAAARRSLTAGGRMLAIVRGLRAAASVDAASHGAWRERVEGFVAETAREVAPARVTCNALVPAGEGDVADEGATPLGRALAPEDVAELAVFLCGNGGTVLTGQTLDVGFADRARSV